MDLFFRSINPEIRNRRIRYELAVAKWKCVGPYGHESVERERLAGAMRHDPVSDMDIIDREEPRQISLYLQSPGLFPPLTSAACSRPGFCAPQDFVCWSLRSLRHSAAQES